MAHAQIQTPQYRRQDARRKILSGGAAEMISDKNRALQADGEPNAETLAAMEELIDGRGTPATIDELRAMIYEKN